MRRVSALLRLPFPRRGPERHSVSHTLLQPGHQSPLMHVQVANNSLGIVEVRGETWEIAQAARQMIEGSLIVPEVGDIRRWLYYPLACCVQLRQGIIAECAGPPSAPQLLPSPP